MKKIDYAKLDHNRQASYVRLKKFINGMPHPLVCQECGGRGGWTETISLELGGPWYECGWCLGLGYVTPHIRGIWLNMKKEEKRSKKCF